MWIETAVTCYVISLLCYMITFFLKWKGIPEIIANIFFSIGFGLVTLCLVQRAVTGGGAPWLDSYGAFLFLSWTMILIFWIFTRKIHWYPLVICVILLSCLSLGYAEWFENSPSPLPVAERSNWWTLHEGFKFLGYGAFAVSSTAGSLSFFRSPLGDELILITHQTMAVGFLLLTAGIIAGIIWFNEEWGTYFGWSAKGCGILMTWVLDALYFHLAMRGKCNIKKGPWIAIAGFTFLILLGVS